MSKSRGLVTKLLLLALGFSIVPLITSSQSAWACSAAPSVPLIKAIWGTTGGPSFTVTPAKTGELPTIIYYNYAIKKVGKDSWEPWANWVQTQVTSTSTSASFTAPMSDSNEFVTFSGYAYNNCGGSGQYQVTLKLFKSDQLSVAHLNIAEDLPLSVETIPYYFFSPMSSEIPQSFTSKNPAVCAFDDTEKALKLLSAGKCEFTISQNNEKLQTPNPDVTQVINIFPDPKILPDSQKDRPDEIPGFQIHVVYVKVKGVEPHEYYQSGDINNWLDLTNAWMKRKLGKEFIFDTYQGTYDVSTMESKYAPGDLDIKYESGNNDETSRAEALPKLRAEFTKQSGTNFAGKNLLFVIDAKLSNSYCGFGSQPGNTALITPGSDKCWYPEFGYLAQNSKFNSESAAIAHELIHNLGAGHVCEGMSDLMVGEGCEFSKVSLETTLDSTNNFYVKSSKAGANILDLKVWKDGSGIKYIPTADACYINQPCMVSEGIWDNALSDLQIQEKIAGKWKTIQTFKIKKKASGKYSYDASIKPTTKGIHTYREYVPGSKKFGTYTGKQFTKNVVY